LSSLILIFYVKITQLSYINLVKKTSSIFFLKTEFIILRITVVVKQLLQMGGNSFARNRILTLAEKPLQTG